MVAETAFVGQKYLREGAKSAQTTFFVDCNRHCVSAEICAKSAAAGLAGGRS